MCTYCFFFRVAGYNTVWSKLLDHRSDSHVCSCDAVADVKTQMEDILTGLQLCAGEIVSTDIAWTCTRGTSSGDPFRVTVIGNTLEPEYGWCTCAPYLAVHGEQITRALDTQRASTGSTFLTIFSLKADEHSAQD